MTYSDPNHRIIAELTIAIRNLTIVIVNLEKLLKSKHPTIVSNDPKSVPGPNTPNQV